MGHELVFIKCYRYTYRSNCDLELVWELVQRHNGFMNIHGDIVDFFIHDRYEGILLLAFGSELIRYPALDYIE